MKYKFDGSIDGIFSCILRCFLNSENPTELIDEVVQLSLTDEIIDVETDYENNYPGKDNLCFIAAGVRFGYVNRLYFKIKADDLVLVNSNSGSELVKEEDGTYTLYTDAIYATEFDKVIVAFTFSNGKMIQAVEYSVKSYVFAKQNGNDDMAALAKALYNYGRSARAYKNAQ